jgi:hypothetical protein
MVPSEIAATSIGIVAHAASPGTAPHATGSHPLGVTVTGSKEG